MNLQVQIMLSQAIQSFQGGNLERAESILKKIIQLDSKNWTALHIYGLVKASNSKHEDAVDLMTRAVRIKSEDSTLQYNLAKALSDCGRHDDAISHHQKAVELASNNPNAWLNYGKTLLDKGQQEAALTHFDRALKLNPNYFEAWINKGNALYELKRYEEALNCYNYAILYKSDFAKVYFNKGNTLNALQRYEEAVKEYDKAIKFQPENLENWICKGDVLVNLKRYEEALTCYDCEIINNSLSVVICIKKGNILFELKRYEEALHFYDRVLNFENDYPEAWSNKANALRELKLFEESLSCYDKALKLKPDFADAWFNKGNLMYELNRYREALENYDQALKIKPNFAEVYSNKGNLLSKIKMHQAAASSFFSASDLGSKFENNIGRAHHQLMMICNWADYKKLTKHIFSEVKQKKRIIEPFALMATSNSNELIKICTEIYVLNNFPSIKLFPKKNNKNKSKKIRIGYLSGEFRNQATSHLLTGIWELHDRTKFETYAFDNGYDDNSKYRERIKLAFNKFIDISRLSDLDAAKLIIENEIDVLINLNGFFGLARTGIFAYRAAPIQVNYLGYPGTMGASYIDYIIADPILIPPEFQEFYTEKVVYLPHSYQANDGKREISERKFSRAEVGLPEKGFVFCCFNNNYKILPETFDIWMRLLHAVDQSILWLLEDNPTAAENLRIEAGQRGIDPSRLVFAQRLPSAEHLARHALADLFVDTFPYNAHTTASDALWAGLPLITLQGESFASRVASSLLLAIGLPELITHTLEEYEALAIELAMDPQKLAFIKQKLVNNRLTTPLFDTSQFTKHLENAYQQMYDRYQADLAPEHIYV